jgi:hypothetical protein
MARSKPAGGHGTTTRAVIAGSGDDSHVPDAPHGSGVVHVVVRGVHLSGEAQLSANAEVIAAPATETDVFDAWFAEFDGKLDDLDRRQETFFRKMGVAVPASRDTPHDAVVTAEFEN